MSGLLSLLMKLQAARGTIYEPPSDAEMSGAPVLHGWYLLAAHPGDSDQLPAIAGIVAGHPLVPNGGLDIAAELVALDVDAGYAVTLTRWYRLGATALDGGGNGHS